MKNPLSNDHSKRLTRFFAAGVLAATVFVIGVIRAQAPQGFGMWTPADLKQHEEALNGKMRPDHSARETLGDYGNHRIRLIRRVATGAPEFHANYVDLWIVESGHGTLVVGGDLIDGKALVGEETLKGDMTGSGIKGGERRPMSAGDVIHIPPSTAHQAVVPEGGEITYLRIAIPAH